MSSLCRSWLSAERGRSSPLAVRTWRVFAAARSQQPCCSWAQRWLQRSVLWHAHVARAVAHCCARLGWDPAQKLASHWPTCTGVLGALHTTQPVLYLRTCAAVQAAHTGLPHHHRRLLRDSKGEPAIASRRLHQAAAASRPRLLPVGAGLLVSNRGECFGPEACTSLLDMLAGIQHF